MTSDDVRVGMGIDFTSEGFVPVREEGVIPVGRRVETASPDMVKSTLDMMRTVKRRGNNEIQEENNEIQQQGIKMGIKMNQRPHQSETRRSHQSQWS